MNRRGNGLPKPTVLICSVLEEPFRIQTAMKLGASGYVSKAESETVLIAAELCLSVGTVRNHVSNIYFKTETNSRQELMKL